MRNNYQNTIGYAALGDSDIIADPMFVRDTVPNHAMNFDYHLQEYSPAIDKGDPNIIDKDGTRSDIGVYGGPFGEIYTYQELKPRPPRNLSALLDTFSIRVKWNKNTEADTSFYKVYRDTVINFPIDSTKLVSSQADTIYNQSIPHKISKYVYKITCVDKQGNESKPSEEIVVNITGINDYPMTINDYFLYQNYPNPFNPSTTSGYSPKLNKVISAEEIIEFQDLVRKVPIADNVIEFAVKVASKTRPSNDGTNSVGQWISWGAGPRASQYMVLSAKTRAVVSGRFTPNIDDIKASMIPVLRHRIITNFNAEAEGISSLNVIQNLMKEI